MLVILPFIVFGSWPVYRSYGDFFVADGFIRNANSTSDRPVLSFVIIVFWFALSRSFIFRINLSTFPFSLWSRIGHSTRIMCHFLQNYLNLLLLNIVAGSVLIVFGIPCLVMYLCKNSGLPFRCLVFAKILLRANRYSGLLILVSIF